MGSIVYKLERVLDCSFVGGGGGEVAEVMKAVRELGQLVGEMRRISYERDRYNYENQIRHLMDDDSRSTSTSMKSKSQRDFKQEATLFSETTKDSVFLSLKIFRENYSVCMFNLLE